MQKNLGYVIPSLVIPDATTGIGYWYLGNVPLGVRATGTMWTIGSDHYWYVDNTKTNYLAEIPVEEYNAQFAELLEGYEDTWTDWLTQIQSDWSTFFNTEGAAFTLWFNRMKNQLSTDAAGNLQAQIDQIGYNFSDYVEPYAISSQAYAVGTYIVHDNRTFEVVKAIAQGDTFNSDESDADHNIEARTIGETIELSAGNVSYDNTDSGLDATEVQGAIDELKSAFSSALTALKNTAIAQAVGATGSTFTAVISKLAEIVNNGDTSKTITAGTSNKTSTIPEGYTSGGTITVKPTPSQSKSVTASRSDQTVTPDSGKLLSSVTVNKYPDASGTFSITSNGTHDMGANNNNRYISANIPVGFGTNVLTNSYSGISVYFYGATKSGNYYYCNGNGAGAYVQNSTGGTKMMYFLFDNNVNRQGGYGNSSSSLPTLYTNGSGRESYNNLANPGNYCFGVSVPNGKRGYCCTHGNGCWLYAIIVV